MGIRYKTWCRHNGLDPNFIEVNHKAYMKAKAQNPELWDDDAVHRPAIKGSKRDIVIARSSGVCAYCHKQFDELTLDHIIPVSNGGTDDLENLVACCHECNSRKNDNNLLSFMVSLCKS
jgi:hypothetical protein